MKATYKKHILNFKRPSGTSRGTLRTKETWFLILEDKGKYGVGECGLFRGLSYDDVPGYEEKLKWVSENITLSLQQLLNELKHFPSIQFGLEQAFLSLNADHPYKLFQTPFVNAYKPITINGLIWMGDIDFMYEQIQQKLNEGFFCIKMKIGAVDFDKEIALLQSIRNRFDKDEIELRVDANGAFSTVEALDKLRTLSTLDLHSIEQPIKVGQWPLLKDLCARTPLPIALDEELIGVLDVTRKEELLQMVQPQYIILKPSLVGGIKGSQEWISIAEKYNIGWWVTSALESNIGLNAIAQWTSSLAINLPQGLGTGALFTNNINSPLEVKDGGLYYSPITEWDENLIENLCT